MFNLKSDLKIYTSDKYLLIQEVMKTSITQGQKYIFEVIAKVIDDKDRTSYDRQKMQFYPNSGLGNKFAKDFREILEIAGIGLHNIESSSNFHTWFKNNPNKTWNDFRSGVSVNLILDKDQIDSAFAKVRPDNLMNDLALSPNSKIAQLIGKRHSQSYRRRRDKNDRLNQLVALWVLFGVEVAISSSSKDLDSILAGITFHDFGITHCENMMKVIEFITKNVKISHSRDEIDNNNYLAKEIKALDSLIVSFGGKVPNRSRPRSPFFRELYDFIYEKAAA